LRLAVPRRFNGLAYFIGAFGNFHNETCQSWRGFMVASCAHMF